MRSISGAATSFMIAAYVAGASPALAQATANSSQDEMSNGTALAILLSPIILALLVVAACIGIANFAWKKHQYRVYWNGLNFLTLVGWLVAIFVIGAHASPYLLVLWLICWGIPLFNAIRRTGFGSGVLIWIAQIVGLPLILFAFTQVRGAMNTRNA